MKNKSFENTHSEVLDYLAKHKFTISAFGKTGNSIRIDDKTFTIKDQIAIEKIHPKIHISGSSNSYIWYIFMPQKYAKGSTVKGGGVGDTIADRYARLTKTEAKRLDELSKKVRINEQTDEEDIEWDKLVHKYRGWDYKHAKGSTVKGGGNKGTKVIYYMKGNYDQNWFNETEKYYRDRGFSKVIAKKYADGGGIERENAEMVLNNNKQISHHTKELATAVKGKKVPAWVVAKVNRSASDLSDATHYLDGSKYGKGGTMKGFCYTIGGL